MSASEPALLRSSASDLARVDAHVVQQSEYEELPALDEDRLARAWLRKGGWPIFPNPRNEPSTVP